MSNYRLAKFNLPFLRPREGPDGYLSFCGWLTERLLWIDGWITAADDFSLELQWGFGQPRQRFDSFLEFHHERDDLEVFDGAVARRLVVAVPSNRGATHLSAVWVRFQGDWYRWSLRKGIDIDPDLVAFFANRVGILSPAAGTGFVHFVEESCRANVDSADPLWNRNLESASRLFHRRGWTANRSPVAAPPKDPDSQPRATTLPPSFVGDPAEPLGACIDRLVAIDDDDLLVQGWLWDSEDTVLRVVLTGPRQRVELPIAETRVSRPGVSRMYSPHFARQADRDHGFLTIVRCPGLRTQPQRFSFELVLRDGHSVELGHPPLVVDPIIARDLVFASLPEELTGRDWEIERIVHPALVQLRPAWRTHAKVLDEMVFGLGGRISTSLIVSVGDNLEMLEAQLASFSDDPDLANSELVYVLDHPSLASSMAELLFELHRSYRLPTVRLLVASRAIGHAAAINLGVARARGSEVILLHSDVIANHHGWFRDLCERHRSMECPGAVGARLTYADESIQHAGVCFEQSRNFDRLWQAVHRFRGMPGDLPQAHQSGFVPAVSDACMLVSKAAFEAVGGYLDGYPSSDYEDYDLCLRLAEAGRRNWYQSEVALTHLEGQTKRHADGWNRNSWTEFYCAWLLTHRWKTFLGESRTEQQ